MLPIFSEASYEPLAPTKKPERRPAARPALLAKSRAMAQRFQGWKIFILFYQFVDQIEDVASPYSGSFRTEWIQRPPETAWKWLGPSCPHPRFGSLRRVVGIFVHFNL